ncbi:MAG TPA: 23S rRNA (adenine(2030)-N(6))-methyltransferase RlmJ, partial [Steroidobacteraceae bacterium]|nr:23S rRNA (adenine(2030)-N(6))-methyltransferase RlmJ [Steroidobacteraceae bacterium]
IRRYLEVLEQLGFSATHSSRYPGSPLIASSLLRAVDRAVCIEQQPDEAAALSRELAGRKRTTVIFGDGYRQLKAELPPRERRGLVLIDPPYERASEMAELAQALTLAWTRWPTGVFAAWYPIKAGAPAEALCDSLASSGIRKILCCELCVRPRDAVAGLNGSGLLIVNAPWQLDVRAREIQAALLDRLAEAHAASRVEWLVPE